MKSIETKILLCVVAVMLAGPFISGFFLIQKYSELGRKVSDNVEDVFNVLSVTYERDLRNAMLANQISGIRDSLAQMRQYRHIQTVALLDSEGDVVFDVQGNFIEKMFRKKHGLLSSDEFQRAASGAQSRLEIAQKNPSLHRYLIPFKNEKRCRTCHGTRNSVNGVLVLDLRVPDVRQEVKGLAALTMVFHLLSVLAVSLFLIFFIKKTVIRPVKQLQSASQKVAGGDFSVNVPPEQEDEMGSLIHNFNEMVGQLKGSREALEKSITEKEQARFLAEIGAMVSKIAHEVRNPLNTLEGSAFYLKKTYAGKTDVVEHANLIQKNVKNLSRFSQDLLSFAKPVELFKERVDVHALISEKIKKFLQLRQDKKIEITTHFYENMPRVSLDPFKMDQILENLLQNAMDAGTDIPIISITTKHENHHAHIFIKDRGRGIPPSLQKNIFQPFFTTKKEGTGLGLCIIKKIVERHGGQITMLSVENSGTEVHIQLPAA